MHWTCRLRSAVLLLLVLGLVVLASVPAFSGSGTKSSTPPSTNSGSAGSMSPDLGGTLSEAQRQLCQTAFSNGSGTKFADEAAFVAACFQLFPPVEDGSASDSSDQKA